MATKSPNELRTAVRNTYGGIAAAGTSGCGCGCGDAPTESSAQLATLMGYSEDEVATVPAGSNLGLGCGNPTAIASLQAGETVLDLGSGAGFDCFLAAQRVGESGRVIGVDMTPEMIAKARENTTKAGYANVEFRLGEIEHLPVADESVDVIISNCVINLSPEKPQVFSDAFRVLKSGGRLAIADMIATTELPESALDNLKAYSACVSGAVLAEDVEKLLAVAGFREISVTPRDGSRELIREWSPSLNLEDCVISALIEARKP